MRRRTFLLTGLGAAGALVLGWGLLPPRQRLTGDAPLPLRDGDVALNGWVAIGRDGIVTAFVPKAEMGQGIHTALAMLLAEELDAPWSAMRVAHAPVDRIYGNIATIVDGLPFHPDGVNALERTVAWLTAKTVRELGIMMTGGSSSVKDCWEPMRLAGATARAQLVAAAARSWGVAPGECTTRDGVVRHAASGREVGYGALVATQVPLPAVREVTLKAPDAFRLIGTPVARLEGGAKARGTAAFALDERPPGLLHAAIRFAPVRGGLVQRVDERAALALPKVRALTTVPPLRGGSGGVAVVADDSWHARRAADALDVTWQDPPGGRPSWGDVRRALDAALDGDDEGFAFHAVGDVDEALDRAATVVEARYAAPYLAHATMEPPNCTVRVGDDGVDVWVGTQVPGIARDAVAEVTGVEPARVRIHERLLGGGFGRRLEVDFIAQAAHVARAVRGRPVSVLWSRTDDLRHDFLRPAAVARFRAGLDGRGKLVAWAARSASQAVIPQYARRLFDLGVPGPDKTTAEGHFDVRYEFPHAAMRHVAVPLDVPVGFWRAVGHSHNAFFTESFMDEVAHAARRDPLEFRRALLARHPRQSAVLARLARESGWGTPVPNAPDGARVARGVAFHQSFGTSVGQVAEVSLAPDGTPRVHRVVAVVDCGIAVNPGHVAQQVESGVVFGLSAALHGAVTLADGAVTEANFDGYRLLRMGEAPRVVVHVLRNAHPPEGLGEPGLPPVAPAVANALFALTGTRLRELPLRVPRPGGPT